MHWLGKRYMFILFDAIRNFDYKVSQSIALLKEISMKKLAYGVLSSLLILATAIPSGATTPTTTIAQANSTSLDQMFQEQRVLTGELQKMMAQMKMMMAEMKALTSVPEGQTPTTTDLYKQQQI